MAISVDYLPFERIFGEGRSFIPDVPSVFPFLSPEASPDLAFLYLFPKALVPSTFQDLFVVV
jgi:hypothetical protein